MPILPTPEGTRFGKFVGRWGRFVADTGADPDAHPDFIPASGTIDIIPEYLGEIKRFDLKVSFKLSPIQAALDSEGYLVDANGNRFIEAVASDSPGSPTNIRYTISKNIDGVRSAATGVVLLGDTEVDIQDLIAGPPSQPLFQGSDALLAALLLEPDSQTNAAIQYLTGGGVLAPAVVDGGSPSSIDTTGIDGGKP